MTIKELIEKLQIISLQIGDNATVIIQTRDEMEDVGPILAEPLFHSDDTMEMICTIYGDYILC